MKKKKETFSERLGKLRLEVEDVIREAVLNHDNHIKLFDFEVDDYDDSYTNLPQVNETSRHGFSLVYYVYEIKIIDGQLLLGGYDLESGDEEDFAIDCLSTVQLAYLIDYHL